MERQEIGYIPALDLVRLVQQH